MSIVIDFYPEKANKESLRQFLLSEGFHPTEYFLRPFPKGTLYYAWFEEKEYKSLDGMEAVIYQHEESIRSCKWALFTRTRAYASGYDKQKQNEVIRKAKKQFGGDFHNDHEGKNRYIKIEKSEYFSPIEGGLFQTYERVKNQIRNLQLALKDYKDPFDVVFTEGTHKDIIKSAKENLPSLALYNSLLPFLVSVIEHFFTELFTVLVEFDELGKSKIQELKLRDLRNFNTIEDIYQIKKEVYKIERQIAKGYNFQNLENVNQTFNKILNIDIKKVLKENSILKRKKIDLYETLHEIIERRHFMIHHFGFANDLDKEKFLYFLDITSASIDVITIAIEKSKKINVLDESFYFDGIYNDFMVERK